MNSVIVIITFILGIFAFSLIPLSYSQTGNLTKIIEEKFTRLTPDYSPSPGITYKGVPYVHVHVEYESPTTILIMGDLIISPQGTEKGGTFNSAIWEAMDLLKNQNNFKVQQVMTSGIGSAGNPTVVYILMTK